MSLVSERPFCPSGEGPFLDQERPEHTNLAALQEQKKVSSVAEWEQKASARGAWLERARAEEDRQAARQADLERRSALLAEKLRREEQQLQEELLKKQVTSLQAQPSLPSAMFCLSKYNM